EPSTLLAAERHAHAAQRGADVGQLHEGLPQRLRQHPADGGRALATLGRPGAQEPAHLGAHMRLELAWSDVDEVTAGPATRLAGKRLEIDLDGLRELLSADARLTRIRLDLAHPGERCRIGRVFDVIAPRAKADGGEDFPGVLGAVARAGHGR